MKARSINIFKALLGLFIMLGILWNLKSKLNQDLILSLGDTDYSQNWIFLVLAIILMPLNWYLESYKWYVLVKLRFEVSIFRCFQAVMAGMSIAIFTPNRIGEFAGRILLFDKKYRSSLIWSTIIANYSQVIVIISIGIMGFLSFSYFVIDSTDINFYWFVIANIAIVASLLVLYFNSFFFMKIIMKLIPFQSIKKVLLKSLYPLRNYETLILVQVLLLSLLRYFTYCFQYFLTLRFFNVNLDIEETTQAISSVYLLKTSIPYPPAMGFLMRSEISIWIFQFFTENLLAVIAASTLIWIINVVLPAIFGYRIIAKEDLIKRI